MPIPDYQSCLLPLLQYGDDNREYRLKDAVQELADKFHLTHEEVNEFLPSGQQSVFINRLGWAGTYLKKAGLLFSPRRGYLKITSRGQDVLKQRPSVINNRFLMQFEEFRVFIDRPKSEDAPEEPTLDTSQTPHESLQIAYDRLRSGLVTEILQSLKAIDPNKFEKIVVDVLVKMGYGGNRKDAGQAIGRSGDGGIDGIIKEDHLGLGKIYIQAKRWDATIGRPEVQAFAGALQGQRSKKGILISTSDFTKMAHDYVKNLDSTIVLIDGATLANLMIDAGVGVATVESYEIKRIDSDYFNDI